MKLIQGIAIAICILTAISKAAFGDDIKYDLVYTTNVGTKLDANTALLKSLNGTVIYKCQTVEPKVSKSGTSISLRNVKKPKEVK